MKVGRDKAFPLQFAFVAEVNQVADRLAGDAHIVEELGFVIRRQFGNGFQFDNDPLKDEQIRFVSRFELMIGYFFSNAA